MLIPNLLLSTGLNSLVRPIAASNVLLNWSQLRFRKAVYFRKYQQPFFRQKVLLAVCEPVFATDKREPAERCFNLTPHPPKPDHPYDVLLSKDMVAETEASSLICFFHQNQMTNPDKRLVKNEFEHEGMFLRYYNRDIARLAWAGSRYEKLLHFAIGYEFTVLFAPSTEKINKIIRIAKKYPEVLLLGALVDKRRMVTLKQLEEISKMADLDMQRAMLCNTLTVSQQGLLQSLNHHSTHLTQLLKTHANPDSTGETKSE